MIDTAQATQSNQKATINSFAPTHSQTLSRPHTHGDSPFELIPSHTTQQQQHHIHY